jgi:HD-GYP domain-containing protein (c-di-GMP phosphodiesterase class II)
MSRPLRKIDVDGLRVGMYVSQLDRPWIETPFLFQGFFIRNDHEIEELRRYCDFVEIDIEESDPRIIDTVTLSRAPSARSGAEKSTRKRPGLIRALLGRLLPGAARSVVEQPRAGEYYQDSVSTADELVVARSIHTGAIDRLMHILEHIRNGGSVSMPELQVITGELVDSVLRNSTAMALLMRMQQKDDYTSAHSLETSVWALVFGRHLGLDKEALRAVGLGGMLLEVGKTKIPIQLLNKKGALTDVERAYLKTHVDIALEILRETGGVDSRVMDMVATHHERFDGSGYPKGWKGNQIPVFGRIGGITDSYAAMTNDRPYARAKSSYDAMRELKSLSDKHFQAEMVEQFIQAIGIFPAGTLVELNTGEVGVVLKEHQSDRLRPELAIILGPDKQPLQDFEVIDLQKPEGPTRTVWIERGLEPGAYDIDPRDYFL